MYLLQWISSSIDKMIETGTQTQMHTHTHTSQRLSINSCYIRCRRVEWNLLCIYTIFVICTFMCLTLYNIYLYNKASAVQCAKY